MLIDLTHNLPFTKSELLQLAFFYVKRAMAQTDVVQNIEKLLQPLLSAFGVELVDLEYKREGRQMMLRLYLDKPGGITLDDCAEVSREFSTILDVEDCIPGEYTLEVSSPGLNRPLKKQGDFERAVGKLVKVRTFAQVADEQGNLRKTFLGTLQGLEGDAVVVLLTEGQRAVIPFNQVAKANLEFEF